MIKKGGEVRSNKSAHRKCSKGTSKTVKEKTNKRNKFAPKKHRKIRKVVENTKNQPKKPIYLHKSEAKKIKINTTRAIQGKRQKLDEY